MLIVLAMFRILELHPARRFTMTHLIRSLPDNRIDRLGEVLDVLGVQASHADTAVLGHVDVVLLAESQDLRLGQASEREHADLVGDVVPRAGSLQLLEVVAQCRAHLDDTAGHGAQVALPLGEQLLVVEDCGSNAGTVRRRV
jgi:hypothetical protein